MKPHNPLWTLDELCGRVSRALAVDYSGQASGRVINSLVIKPAPRRGALLP